jgi:hypothetical protein
MFMFVFSVVLMSVVGLFMQVINALVIYFVGLQLAMGQQFIAWHSMATEYACAAAPLPPLPINTSDSSVEDGIRDVRPSYAGATWDTVIFDGTYGGSSTQIVLSYIDPGKTYAGFSGAEATRQFRTAFSAQTHQYSPIYSNGPNNAMNIIIVSQGSSYNIVVSGIPTSVPVNTIGMVAAVNCSP